MKFFSPSTLKTDFFFKNNLMVAYVHIEYSTHQFSEKSKGGGVESIPPRPPVPWGTEKSVVLRGLKKQISLSYTAFQSTLCNGLEKSPIC